MRSHPQQTEEFRALGVKLAELVNLTGIMDVEVIDDGNCFKVLEIDARIPSQTPTAVYQSTGVNFIEELWELFCGGEFQNAPAQKERYCAYEHYLLKAPRNGTPGTFTEQGEHIMSQGLPLHLYRNLFGADEVLTDMPECLFSGFSTGRPEKEPYWCGTFINCADSLQGLKNKRKAMRKTLAHWCSSRQSGCRNKLL